METLDIVQTPPSLEELKRRWRAVARYGIERFSMRSDGYSREKNLMSDYTGLTYDEATTISAKLSREAHEAAGNPPTNWGVTKYFPKLETPLPLRWKRAEATGQLVESRPSTATQ